MKTFRQIQARIAELENDERLQRAPAKAFVNSPLALVQFSLVSELNGLYFALDKKRPTYTCDKFGGEA